jgi:hypothetical protein
MSRVQEMEYLRNKVVEQAPEPGEYHIWMHAYGRP